MPKNLKILLYEYSNNLTEIEKEWIENQKVGCIYKHFEIQNYKGEFLNTKIDDMVKIMKRKFCKQQFWLN